jgi:uncharacterized protein DUF3313
MRALFVPIVLIIAGCATQPPTADGLVFAPTGKFDEMYLRPNADLPAYRRVLIEPVPVKFRSDYLTQRHGSNALLAEPRYKPYQDTASVAQDFSALMQASLIDAFRAANYEIVEAAGPGVLRISARIDELFINAPDRLSSSVRATFNRDTGQATLSLEATDAVSAAVLARVIHRNLVREATRANVADDTTNRFWFETAFRRWAANVTTELAAVQPSAVSAAHQR